MGFFDIFKRRKNKEKDVNQQFMESLSKFFNSLESERNKSKAKKNPDKDSTPRKVKTIKKAYLAVFTAEWCREGKRLIKEIQNADIHDFTVIDVDKDEDMGNEYTIRVLPTTILFDQDGDVIKKWFGYDDNDPRQTNFVQFIKSAKYPILPFSQIEGIEIKEDSVIPHNENHVSKNENEETTIGYFNLSQLKPLRFRSTLTLCPIDAELVFDDKEINNIVSHYSMSQNIGKYLPHLDFSTKESTTNFLYGLVKKTELGLQIGYSIKLGDSIIGFIFVDTPEFNLISMGLEKWTLDFCLFHMYEGKDIMCDAINEVLYFLTEDLSVKPDDIFCLVDSTNSRCLNVMIRLPFREIHDDGFHGTEGNNAPIVFVYNG
jgi:hypothetical protein